MSNICVALYRKGNTSGKSKDRRVFISPNQPKIENPNSDFKIVPNEVSKNVAVYHCEKNAIGLQLDGHFSNCMHTSLLSRSLVILEGDCPRVNTIYEIDHVS